LNIASVNYYFGDKERLYAETVKYACEKSAAKYPMPDWPEKTPARERLKQFISTFVNRLMDPESKPWQTQVIMREMATPTSACQEWIQDYVQPMADKLRNILMELTGEPASNDRVYQIGFSIVGQCLFYRQNRPIGIGLMGPERFLALTPMHVAEHIYQFTAAALGLEPALLRKLPKLVRSRNRVYTLKGRHV
ncbi:MAG TPA: DUF1956 domain-containing protein, partial [Gemmatales bacterium]|nr:DUF1956 domain-containing protein [Gemmatales bacterium]